MNLTYAAFNLGLKDGMFEPQLDSFGNILVTYCNQAMQLICNGMGYDRFHGLNANEMTKFMSDPANGWISVDDAVAQSHANNGVIVIAARQFPGAHGHVCIIVPGILEKSLSWGRAVPKCMNVGKDVFFGKRLSLAFRASEQPTLFALSSMI